MSTADSIAVVDHDSIAAEFAAHGEWISRFVIDGVAYGGSFDGVNDPRIELFFATFPHVRTILELGSLEGAQTIGLASRRGVRHVLGLEARRSNIARAELAARLLRARNLSFVEADLETAELSQFGKFDAIYCCGLLYHLREPWQLVKQFRTVSTRAFIFTHYTTEAEAESVAHGYRGTTHPEAGLDDPLSGLSPYSFWPTIGSLVQMLNDGGFARVEILGNERTSANGPVIALAASL